MITFKIHNTIEGQYFFRLHFKTRFLPAILTGNNCGDEESCLNDIKVTQQQILNIKSLAFTNNKKGYGFTVLSPHGIHIAYSRFFSTQRLMKRILSILQNRINTASVRMIPGCTKFYHAA
jgi:hypothetical protein